MNRKEILSGRICLQERESSGMHHSLTIWQPINQKRNNRYHMIYSNHININTTHSKGVEIPSVEIGSFSLTIRYSVYGVTLRDPILFCNNPASVFTISHTQRAAVIPMHMDGPNVIHAYNCALCSGRRCLSVVHLHQFHSCPRSILAA